MNSTCGSIPNISLQTSCNDCNYTSATLDIPIRAETRTLTMRHDHCADTPNTTMQVFESTKLSTKSRDFAKNDCATGKGSTVTYTATRTATAYSMVSQADADTKAQQIADSIATADANANGQTYANSIGTCA
jgi:hypothetical protein